VKKAQERLMAAEVGFQTHPFPLWRAIVADGYRVAREKSYIHGLFEIDVTEARHRIRDYEARTGTDFSFTAFLIGCIALAVDENKPVQALRHGRHLIVFDDVDVNVQVEHDVNGVKVVSTHIIRAANRKSAHEIHDEIRAAQREKASERNPLGWLPRWVIWLLRLPGPIRRRLLRHVLANPFLIRQMGGTIDVTAIGMFAKGGGWGIPIANHSLMVTVGGIDQQVRYVDGQLCVRELLSITLTIDHNIVDGAPAARFAARLKALIEAAHGLDN
jgi:pyruvate/2-oxoglutarate dehydrogenase complex dihydrolipoamide acyltransferase (E2) component